MASPHPLATALITLIEHFQRVDAPTRDQAAIERASQAYARYLQNADDPWSPISDYCDHGVVIVSRPDDKLYYEPTTAFLDATGVWRVFRSEGGSARLPFEPTHFMPTPPRPKAKAA